MKKFECNGGTYNIDQCIKGQSTLPFYDSLAQIALRPSLREGTIMCYWQTGVYGLFSQLQSILKADKRIVKTNPYWWTEYCSQETIAVTVKKAGAASAAGGTVTLTLAENSHGGNGQFSKVRQGYRVYFKELKGQGGKIESVNKNTAGQHTVTVRALNGEVLDLTVFNTYTMVVDTLRMYTKGDDTCITKHGLVSNPPLLRKGWVQKFEDGICVHEDEIDGYAYDVEFLVVKGLDSNGKAINMWYVPQINTKLEEKVMDSRNINTLWGIRDDVSQQGFDGLVTTADEQGSDSTSYDMTAGTSLRQILFNRIRQYRKTSGCTDRMLLYDFGFKLDWSNALSSMISEFKQEHIYSLFGAGGEGSRNLKMFEFKDFEAHGYFWRGFQIDGFDEKRYGNFQEDFAIDMPACSFKDTNGKVVPPVTFVNIQGSEEAWQSRMWQDDTRDRGCRTVDFYVKDSYGMEIHCASKISTMRKRLC